MNETGEMQQLGAFEPADAKRVLSLLEAQGIPFEVEADDSEMTLPGREVAMFMGMYPRGSQVVILVPASSLQAGLALIRGMYPAERPPAEQIG